MTRTRLTCVVIAAITVVFRAPDRGGDAKLDRALTEWLQRPTTAVTRVLIQPLPGTVDRVRRHLSQVAPHAVLAVTSDGIAAELHQVGLHALLGDRDVAHVSSGRPI